MRGRGLHPDCNSLSALGSQARALSMHRVCAQRGADDALSSASNFYETLQHSSLAKMSQMLWRRQETSRAGLQPNSVLKRPDSQDKAKIAY
ncbi:hypothetical protein JRI60_49065 [Archangium violaceum]|uniref:hypothetical protein n=1 Tax=Archangium violaceum TaxID=83451 RepID=UPI001951A7F6|nr:hypothetical protein [Archangium violaceum]QRN96848.1 hypothetical protein JRI60_49065 [Archangium violaceum]